METTNRTARKGITEGQPRRERQIVADRDLAWREAGWREAGADPAERAGWGLD